MTVDFQQDNLFRVLFLWLEATWGKRVKKTIKSGYKINHVYLFQTKIETNKHGTF